MSRAATRSRPGLVSATIAALALTASACIADETDPNVAIVTDGDELTIVMDEYSFSPPRVHVDAGTTIRLTLINEGSIDHELMIGQQPRPEGGYANDLLALLLPIDDATGSSVAAPETRDDTGTAEHAHDEDTTTTTHDDTGTAEHAHDEDTTTTSHDDTGTAEHAHDEDTTTTSHDDTGTAEHAHDEGMDHAGAHITLRPGETIEIILAIPSDANGQWELGCFIESHYEEGMNGILDIR